MSSFSGKGLSILISVPLVQGDDVIDNVADIVESYQHTISANGGYISADIVMKGNQEFLEGWLQYGLGRDIKVFGPQQQLIWEGYVNQVDVTMGGATFTRGPLSNLGNRVSAMYTPYMRKCTDLNVDPDCVDDGEPITGTTTETPIVEDFYSQSKYGIWEKVLNIGEAWPVDAEYIRDIFLTESAYPEGNPSLSLSSNEGDLSLKLSCRGYIDWLGYSYNYETDNLSDEVSDIIIQIVTAEPNGIFSTQHDKIDYNPIIIPRGTSENKTAATLIGDILALGGGNYDRWTFGVYGGRKFVYTSIPTDVEYVYYKTGRTQQVETMAGAVVEPWDVLPCKWVAIPTFLTGFGIKIEDYRNDPRVFFGEEVSYTAPDQVTISGAKLRRLEQLLAQKGLA